MKAYLAAAVRRRRRRRADHGQGAQLADRPRDGRTLRADRPASSCAMIRHEQVHRLPDLHPGLQDDLDLGPGQEFMLWNNVETKPYGFYPLGWDVNLLESLGEQTWTATSTRARRCSRPRRRASACSAGAPRTRLGAPQHRRGRLDGQRRRTASPRPAALADVDVLPAADLQPLHVSALPRVPARARRSTSGRRTASCSSTRPAAAATRSASPRARTRR